MKLTNDNSRLEAAITGRQDACPTTECRAGFQPAGFSGILPEVSSTMKPTNDNSRLEAATTGRQDACPTSAAPHLTAGFHARDHLPHLKKEGGSYFVTFRLAGTLPATVLQQFKQEREQILQHALAAKRPLTWPEQEELFRWYSVRVDAYLDAGHGECFLRQPEIARVVADALRFFDGQRYELRAWVVMPNHVHVVVWPRPPETLSRVLHSWKSFTSKEANKMLGRAGAFWQGESYDHLIRDDDDHARCVAYTINNPVSARLCARPEDWQWSSAYRPPV